MLYTAYPNTFLGRVFDFLGCPYIFSDKLSGPGINYPGTYPGGPTRLFSSTYKSTPTVIPSVKTVITRVDTLNVMYHRPLVHQNRKIEKLLAIKPKSCQNHADLWEAKFMPNSCQKLAKFMPNVCQPVASLVRVHWWCGVRPFCNQCSANRSLPYKTRYFHGCYTLCARLQPKVVLCRG
jgi:hypothetical protein